MRSANFSDFSSPDGAGLATTFITKYVGNSDAGWNFTGNHPNWRGARAAFYPNIQDLLFGDKTPEEVAANIDAACNAAIDAGYASMKLHE